MVLSLVSPLLDGPFLISPSRRQSATPGESHTRKRSSLFFHHQGKLSPACAALAPRLPQGRLRGEVPTELKKLGLQDTQIPIPEGSGSLCLFSFSLDLPAGLPASRSRYISTHRVSTYDPLARRSTPSLDSRLAPDCLSILSGIYRDPHGPPTPVFVCRACGLHCLSRISVWSDLRRHRLTPPTDWFLFNQPSTRHRLHASCTDTRFLVLCPQYVPGTT